MVAGMPVSREGLVVELEAEAIDNRHDALAHLNGQGAAVAEIVLDIHHDECVAGGNLHE